MKPNYNTIFLLLIFMFLLNTFYAAKPMPPVPKPKFSAIFAFGDSLVDTGTNNFLHAKLQANYYPYGVDFPTHNATGRFSDGKVLPDMIASLLGIKELVPPYLNVNLPKDELVTGVNFASAGAGFDDLTTLSSNGAPVSEQLFFFTNYLHKLTGLVGEDAAKKTVAHSLVIINAGTFDWIFNFYNPPRLRKAQYTFDGYTNFLLKKTQDFVQQLYDIGCRTFVVAGLPPIGCLPFQQFYSPSSDSKLRPCISRQVLDPITYNGKLQGLIATMRVNLPRAKLFYANIFDPLFDMINNPMTYGFAETRKGCCVGEGLHEATLMCNPAKPCKNPSQYLFWDNIHPTEAAYKYLTKYMQMTIIPYL